MKTPRLPIDQISTVSLSHSPLSAFSMFLGLVSGIRFTAKHKTLDPSPEALQNICYAYKHALPTAGVNLVQ